MKTTFLTIGLVIASVFIVNAQEISKNAIGIRFGDNGGFGGEISYQRKMSEINRLEVDLGIRSNTFKATGIYQWVWKIEDRFNWYAGFGGGVGTWKDKMKNNNASKTFFYGAGNIGVEYSFDIPLLISIDYRPEFGLGSGYYNGLNSDVALGLRYQF